MALSNTASSTPPNSTAEYYPHLDGIRAFAVIPVFLYHLNAVMCPGGFAGVDVFFVLSGYLITGGIIRDLSKGTFTIGNFYFRRIRRIIPAYTFVIFCVLLAGIMIFYSHPLCALSDSAAASSLFLSNIYFWILGGDYFASKTLPQPLLHLWSLGVEEQFYLAIPLVCAAIWRPSKQYLLLTLLGLATASLFASVTFVLSGRSHDAFFLPHLRAWELLSGSLLALLPKVCGELKSPRRSIWAICGIAAILIGYYTITSKSPFPGTAAIPFVAGTLLLIRHRDTGPLSFILKAATVRLVGRISYSLYLWHWPIIVFWKYCVYDQLLLFDYLGIITLTFTMSFLSWRFIETPVRRSSRFTKRSSYLLAVGSCTAVLAIGSLCSYYKGWPSILHPEANRLAGNLDPISTLEGKLKGAISRVSRSELGATVETFDKIRRERERELFNWGGPADSEIGLNGKPEILLLGDSYAGALQFGLDSALRDAGISGHVISKGATPMFDLRQPEAKSAFELMMAAPTIKIIVLCQNWSGYTMGHGGYFRNTHDVMESLTNFAAMVKGNNKQLLILESIPTHEYALNEIKARMEIVTPRNFKPEWVSLRQPAGKYSIKQGAINAMLRQVASTTGATSIPIQDALFESDGHRYFINTRKGLSPLYKDRGHFSPVGSNFVAAWLFGNHLSVPLANIRTPLELDLDHDPR